MSDSYIVAGDVVRLKSGGPQMTVEGSDNKTAKCTWFDEDGGYHSEVFSKASLSKES